MRNPNIESNTRLYHCWENMKQRSKKRGKGCNVHKDWDSSFSTFKAWSIANGYHDELILCRNKDIGDYSPENCRWDTQTNNRVEAFAKDWVFTDPEGKVISIYNLHKFCKENSLITTCMHRVHNGKQLKHKGWTIG